MDKKLRIALFDVDGTLVNSGGAGSRSLFRALNEIIPHWRRPHGYIFDGKTDVIIVRELLAAHGLNVDLHSPVIGEVLSRYTEFLDEEIARASEARTFPGVLPLIQVLEKEPGCRLGLLTGNIRAGAMKKLGRFDLWRFFQVGVFGNEGQSRDELPVRALEKCRSLFDSRLEPSDLVIIGDTPSDISCGRKNGNRTIAVATGRFSLEDLQVLEPDHIFPDLSSTRKVMAAILEG